LELIGGNGSRVDEDDHVGAVGNASVVDGGGGSLWHRADGRLADFIVGDDQQRRIDV